MSEKTDNVLDWKHIHVSDYPVKTLLSENANGIFIVQKKREMFEQTLEMSSLNEKPEVLDAIREELDELEKMMNTLIEQRDHLHKIAAVQTLFKDMGIVDEEPHMRGYDALFNDGFLRNKLP